MAWGMYRILNQITAVLLLLLACLLYSIEFSYQWICIVLLTVLAVWHIWLSFTNKNKQIGNSKIRDHTITELVLLGDEDNPLASWNLYGKTSMVIGRDVGESSVTVNLDNSIYASMIDVEHAVLNYSGNSWYIEDVSRSNGVSIKKEDRKKYKLSYGKPCKLEYGDIIYIALAKLQVQ